jgi:hypothetical protein
MIRDMYRSARHAGMSSRVAVTKIGRTLGIPASEVRRELGIR